MDLEKKLKDSVQRVSHDEKFREGVLENLNRFYTIHISHLLAHKHPLKFDMRKDLWLRPDRFLFASYYETFEGKFSPVKDLRKHLFSCAKLLEKIWLNKLQSKYPEGSQHWESWKKGWWKTFCEEYADEILKKSLPEITKTLAEKNSEFQDEKDPIRNLSKWILSCGEKDPEESIVNFQYRIQAIPYFIANSEEDLPNAAVSALAWDSLFTSTNAYKWGGKQKFAPMLGNEDCERLLSIVDQWASGKNLQQVPFTGFPRIGNQRVDASKWTTITELYGFLKLNKIPYINDRNRAGFEKLFEIKTDAIADFVGSKIYKTLESNVELFKNLANCFDLLKKEVKAPRARLRPESNTQTRLLDYYLEKDKLIEFVDREYDRAYSSFKLPYTEFDKAVALSHLLLDREIYMENNEIEPVPTHNNSESEEEKVPHRKNSNTKMIQHPLNTILCGPPGTGKTYHAVYQAIEIIDGTSFQNEASEELRRKKAMHRFNELKTKNRIQMVTFHQSYCYEDFIEGYRPELSEEGGQLKYRLQAGVLRQFVSFINTKRLVADQNLINEGSQIWRLSLGDQAHFNFSLKDESIGVDYDIGEDISGVDLDSYFQKRGLTVGRNIMGMFRDEITTGDLICIFNDAASIKAVGIVIGAYYYDSKAKGFTQRRKVRWLDRNVRNILDLNGGKRMMTPALHKLPNLKIDQLIKLIGTETLFSETSTTPYVLIVDEINRGNLSKIFGELITLIEADKREGAINAMSVRLPYSGDSFILPKNLHIIATMNTADRSIALLDFALRRRFVFKYLDTDPSLIPETIENIPLRAVIEKINEKLELHLGRDYKIGHSMLMGIKDLESLKNVWSDQILPLLFEYLFDDWKHLKDLVPGFVEEVKDNGSPQFRIKSRTKFDEDFAECLKESLEPRQV